MADGIMTAEDAAKERNARIANANASNANASRDAAELEIVKAIVRLANKYSAVDDLKTMTDITIPNLRSLAEAKNVPDEEFGALITELTPFKWQLEAVTGMVWSDCWDGLKSRFSRWMDEIVNAE